jgi:hypothetical protein
MSSDVLRCRVSAELLRGPPHRAEVLCSFYARRASAAFPGAVKKHRKHDRRTHFFVLNRPATVRDSGENRDYAGTSVPSRGHFYSSGKTPPRKHKDADLTAGAWPRHECGTVNDTPRIAGLAKLAAHWPAARIIEIWNSLPGGSPIKKLTDRKTTVSRIWKAIQNLNTPGATATARKPAAKPLRSEQAISASPVTDVPASVTPQAPHVAPAEAPANIIVVGASSGGVKQQLVRGFPVDLPAAVFVVLHSSPDGPTLRREILNTTGPLPASNAVMASKLSVATFTSLRRIRT